jgi:choline kinase
MLIAPQGFNNIAISTDARVKTAVILAAGTGSRLRPVTRTAPKCLTNVGGQTILGRLVDNLRLHDIRRLVVVTGYLANHIHEFLDRHARDLQVDYVFNPIYQTTNNIYSLWLARQVVREPFLLVESDLVFKASILDTMLIPDRIAVSRMLKWMNGTTVELDEEDHVQSFHPKGHVSTGPLFKTVNVYSLSASLWRKTIFKLDDYIQRNRVNEYYESVFSDLVADRAATFEAVFFDEDKWYEVDTLKDLAVAESMFAPLTRSALLRKRGPLAATAAAAAFKVS